LGASIASARMRVLLFSWEYPPVIAGGLGRHVAKLSEQLALEGAEVHVVTRGDAGLPRHETQNGVQLHRVSLPPFPTDDLDAFLRWVQDMNLGMRDVAAGLGDQLNFELVHSHDWLVATAAELTARNLGVPWLVTVHATEFGRHQGWVRRHPQSRIHAAERHMARQADALITCSEFMRGHVGRVFDVPEEHITVIPNGIDARELMSGPPEQLRALRNRFAEPDELLVLLVGRLAYEKGFHLALEAMAPLAGLRFVLAGAGGAEVELRAQARRLGLDARGSFLGWVGDDALHSLYRVADVCIVPSIYEPFGLVALEAMACGCLCVVADTGGLREVVPGGERVGLRFPAAVPSALREILERLLANEIPREQMISAARVHVMHFDWIEVTRQTLDVYANLCAGAVDRTGVERHQV
jgi:glycogen(starch) synthase